MTDPLIEFRDVHKRFGPLVVLDGVSVRVEKGETLVVIGASGSGKSVMLKHVVGLLKPDSGEVLFDGKPVDQMKEAQLMQMRRRCGFLFQGGALFDSLTVGENVAFPMREQSHRSAHEITELVKHKLALVGLPGIESKLPEELSGGQKKRVALARAIAMEPEVIFYDEPTTGLDPIRSDVINELILKLQKELNLASLVVTHDMHSAFKVANRIVMLFKGKIIFQGTPDEIRTTEHEEVKRFVEGRADDEELAAIRGANEGDQNPINGDPKDQGPGIH